MSVRRFVLLALVVAVASSSASAETVTWVVGSGNVNIPTNWSPQRVPNINDLASLPYRVAGAYQVTVDLSNWAIDGLEVGSNATLYLGTNTVSCDKTADIYGTLNVGSGQTNSIQNAVFYGHIGTTTASEGATLEITGSAYFDSTSGSSPIAESGAGGYLKINGSGAFFSGCGTVQPDVTVAQGPLISSYVGRTLALTGTLAINSGQ